MKLELKLAAGVGVIFLTLLATASIATWHIHQADRLAGDAARSLSILTSAGEARAAFMRNLSSIQEAGTQNSAVARLQSRFTDSAALDKTFARLLDLSASDATAPGQQQLLEIRAEYARWRAVEAQAAKFAEDSPAHRSRRIDELYTAKIVPLAVPFDTELGALVGAEQQRSQADIAALEHSSREALAALWMTTLLGAIIGGAIWLLVARRVLHGISLAAERACSIASGDLTGLTLEIGPSKQARALAGAIQQMQTRLSGIIHSVAYTARSLSVSAASMSAATDHIHSRFDQQTQQTQQAATALQEMSASIAEVSRHTHSAAETARSAAHIAHAGGDIVTEMLGAMEAIAAAVSEASSTIGLLGEDSRRISQIVTVINEIATKTNLLALNAAIEAARAGEHGRGFAVVAGEVRHLAENTAKATSEISAMIQGIQQRTRTAIASMESGTRLVEQGVVTTAKAGRALERIIEIAEQVDRMIAQIAIAASQQASAADQSSNSLDAIHALSNDNLAEIATTTRGIDILRETAAFLTQQVGSFRLAEPEAGSPSKHEQATASAAGLFPAQPLGVGTSG